MGCGCKNKGNTASNATEQTSQVEDQAKKLEAARKINEDVKSAIKQTIEKYYNKGKK